MLAATAALAVAARAAPSRVTLVEPGPPTIAFDVEVPPLALAPVAGEDGMVRAVLEDYVPGGAPGAPALPARVLTVAIPPDGEVQVRVTASVPEVRDRVLLAPVPAINRDETGSVSEVSLRDPAAYAAPHAGAATRGGLLQTAWLRNQRVAQIAVAPLDYEPAGRRLTVWRRIHVEVSVAAAAAGVPAERNDPFEGVYRSLLVNYEQGRGWRRPAGRIVPARAARAGLAGIAQTVPDTSVFVGRDWVKVVVNAPGFYKLTYGQVRSFPPFQSASVAWSDLRLFTWPGYPVLPEQSYCDSCDYREIPFGEAEQSGNPGLFDANTDFIYFYAMGPSDWASVFDPSRPDSAYINHPYETANACFLTVSTPARPIPGTPRRIGSAQVDADPGSLDWTSVPARQHLEVESDYYPNSPPLDGGLLNGLGMLDGMVWQKWFWITVGRNDSRIVTFDLPGLDPAQAQSTRVRFKVWGLTVPSGGFSVVNHVVPTLNNIPLPEATWFRKASVTYDTTLDSPRESGNSLVLANPPEGDNLSSRVGIGFIEARYPRLLKPVDDRLTIEVPATGQRTRLTVGPFSSGTPPEAFDISDVYNPLRLQGWSYDANLHQLVFTVDGLSPRRFTFLPNGGFATFPVGSVAGASRTSEINLRRLGADYMVIYYDAFAAAAESLATWRSTHLPLRDVTGPYVTRTVPISAIYDQFSGGRTDPLALRNFLRASFYAGDTVGTGASGGRRIAYVTFLGDASFDFKNLRGKATPGQPGCLLPTYENGYDGGVEGGRKFTSDDWLANIDDASTALPDIFTGRIPVDDAAQAMDMVRNKILFYERSAPLGEYRNRVVLVADDTMQCDLGDAVRWGHTQHTAVIDTTAIPPHFERTYIYMVEYPRASDQSCLKPSARVALQKAFNDGAVLVNFVGHGSPFQLADEQVMVYTDVATMVNGPRYPLFCTWSCDVGLFDDPLNQSLGERMVLQPGGGSIAVISSTELALSGFNETLNRLVFQKLFERDSVTGRYRVPLAEALVTGKVQGARPFGFLDPTALKNNVKYQLLGDAAAKLNLPDLWVEVALRDSGGSPVTELARGALLRIDGRVLTAPGGTPVPIRGVASLLIEDAPPPKLGLGYVGYYSTASPIYRGSVTIADGVVGGAFVVPLEARLGHRGRVRAYIDGLGEPGRATEDDGAGARITDVIPGTSSFADSSGPVITLSFPGGATEVRPDAELEIRISDPSGILITDHVPQNGIIVTVDDNSTSRVDVTSTFHYEEGSYQSGLARFQLPGLAVGAHRVQVSAADNLAAGFSAGRHRSSAAIDFEVVETPALRVARAYLFPDPACSRCRDRGGQFLIDVPGDSVNVLLRMYTVSGKLVRSLTWLGGIGRVQIPWDGLDEEHQPLANGVYVFRVNVNARQPDGKSSPRQHSVGDGRFVIVNR